MLFSFKTLNGRFIWGIIIFFVFLVSLTLYSHHTVQQSASSSLEYIRNTQSLTEKLNSLTSLVEVTESKLHQYSTFLRDDLRDEILSDLESLEHQAHLLQSNTDLLTTKSLSQSGEQLVVQSAHLKKIVRQYIDIMQNIESRFPAMPILQNNLNPNNRKFSEAVEQAVVEGEMAMQDHRVESQEQYLIIQLFEKVRYAWSMQISWFRMFVANRMGAFGDPKTAMKNNMANRNLFAEAVVRFLKELNEYAKQDKLSIQQEVSLEQMNEAARDYNRHLNRAVSIYLSKNWRADVALVRDQLQPALNKYWDTLHQMERGISEVNKTGLSSSQHIAQQLSEFIWLFTGIMSAMLMIAYSVFQRKIRKPVIQLARSMQAGVALSQELPSAEGNLEEINRLIESYCAMRRQVHNRQLRLKSILDNAAESIITIDSLNRIESFNKAASRLFKYDQEEVVGQDFSLLLSGHELPQRIRHAVFENKSSDDDYSDNGFEVIGQRKDESQFYMAVKFSEMLIGEQILYTAIVEDISERRAVMEHLRHLAEHDSLTGLYNRKYFNDEIEIAVEQAIRQPDSRFACCYIDLDNFKFVNDTLGHLEGDRLLIGIANTLSQRTRKTDILARLGGDEFALLLHNVDEEQVMQVAEEFRRALSEFTFISDGKTIQTGCSIGIALFNQTLTSKDELLSRADIACHMAKRAGRNRVYLFEEEDKNSVDNFRKDMGWANRIRDALENDDFMFVCQPMMNLKNGNICCHELLLRMRDPETGNYLLPGGFLNAAERFGLMPEIDRWVIKHAFNWLSYDERAINSQHSYFINVSGKSIGDVKLLEHVKGLLPALAIAPERITFEITEDVAIAELQSAKHFLAELRRMGFKTALDDFGVGYSSFSYLRELDVDIVKIDGSFVSSMHKDELNLALVKAMNQICHILGKKTVAEYVEDDFALKLLKDMGVDFAQGYRITELADDQAQTMLYRVS